MWCVMPCDKRYKELGTKAVKKVNSFLKDPKQRWAFPSSSDQTPGILLPNENLPSRGLVLTNKLVYKIVWLSTEIFTWKEK